MDNKREKLGSRLGFILLSAGCAIGCGNVWKFPWMTGQFGGGGFVLVYILCLIFLGLPAMIMEFALGRASQASIVRMYNKLERPGQKWHIHGYFALLGNIALMSFYTVVTGWIIYYFVKFLTGANENFGFVSMITDPAVNVAYLLITVALAFVILSYNIQSGLERVTKYMMTILIMLMLVLAGRSMTLSGVKEGLSFYLIPDFSKINGRVIVAAMNQAFFTLSLGIGSMAIFGSYIGKERSLMGESVRVIVLDTFVAVMAGLIMFPACFTYGIEVNAGPALLFNTMATVFNNMAGGRIWGTLFFLFMTFASFSTVIDVFENLIKSYCDNFGWDRKKASVINCIFILAASMPCVLGYNIWSNIHLIGGRDMLDSEDFIVSNLLLPIGALIYTIFCTTKWGWGFDNFLEEANKGEGFRLSPLLKPYFQFVLPLLILIILIQGLL